MTILMLLLATATPALVAADSPGDRDRIVRSGMSVLGGWATLNIAGGVTGLVVAEDPVARGFYEMNALWNTVNLALAGTTLLAEARTGDGGDAMEFSLLAYREESHRLEKLLLFNAGLDVGYMALGGWLWERGSRGQGLSSASVSADRLTGWGQALVLQGAFLFFFDLILARQVAADRQRTESTLLRSRRSF